MPMGDMLTRGLHHLVLDSLSTSIICLDWSDPNEFNHTLVILFSMVVPAQILTYVIPAGSYDRVETESGRMQVVSGSFRLTPDTPVVPIFASLTAIAKGFSSSAYWRWSAFPTTVGCDSSCRS